MSEPNADAAQGGWLSRWLLLAWVAVCGVLYARTVLDARAPGWREAIGRLRP